MWNMVLENGAHISTSCFKSIIQFNEVFDNIAVIVNKLLIPNMHQYIIKKIKNVLDWH